MMDIKLAPCLFALCLLALLSCQNNFVIEEKKSIPGGQWMYRDTLDFQFNISDTAALYNLYVDFEHAADFPNQNLYVRLHTRFPDGKRLSKPRSFDLFSSEGKPTGKCSGDDCTLRAMLQENTYFNQPGEYLITIEQYMRQDSLPGIKAVGLAIEKIAQGKGKQ